MRDPDSRVGRAHGNSYGGHWWVAVDNGRCAVSGLATENKKVLENVPDRSQFCCKAQNEAYQLVLLKQAGDGLRDGGKTKL